MAEGTSAQTGTFRPWPYQRDILDAYGDPSIERISVIKCSRIGYTKTLAAIIGVQSHDDPCPIIVLLPTADDVRRFAIEEVDPVFDESPPLSTLILRDRLKGRSVLTTKRIVGGGSVKMLAARSPRNLRAHSARVLLVDEEDAMEVTNEGDPIPLGEKRTLEYVDRKIVRGSSPRDEATSTIYPAYEESDQRVFEVPCPHCTKRFEMMWDHIRWPEGQPEKAVCVCPHCSNVIEESRKTEMVWSGRCRATRPEVKGHAGFRFNALISLLPKARWGILAVEFLDAKRAGPSKLQPFINTTLGQVWRSSTDDFNEDALAARAENFGLTPGDDAANRFPVEVLSVLAGVDTQPDRFEATMWGFSETQSFALGHFVIPGNPGAKETQDRLDELLNSTWLHPNGWRIGIDAVAIDSGGLNTQQVYDYCAPRLHKLVYPIKGVGGPRRIWEPSKQRKANVRLIIVGVDQVKAEILQHLSIKPPPFGAPPTPGAIRFSSDLKPEFYEQLTGEYRHVRYTRGRRAIVEFRPKRSGQRVEAFDCAVYAHAVKRGVYIDFEERKTRTGEPAPVAAPTIRKNDWLRR